MKDQCSTCKGAGVVWARANAFPQGFKVFAGSALPRSEDRQHVEIVCPACNGASTGRRLGPAPANEAEHFMNCNACGQAFDMRDFSQVAYHEEPAHKPRPAQ